MVPDPALRLDRRLTRCPPSSPITVESTSRFQHVHHPIGSLDRLARVVALVPNQTESRPMLKAIAATIGVGLGALLIFLGSLALSSAGVDDPTMTSEAMSMIIDATSAIYRPNSP